VGEVEVGAFRFLRDAGIAWRGEETSQQRRLRELPGQRVLAPVGADEKDVHGLSQSSSRRSFTRENSRVLRVIGISPRDKALFVMKPAGGTLECLGVSAAADPVDEAMFAGNSPRPPANRKSTRLNSSHVKISYAVFCL